LGYVFKGELMRIAILGLFLSVAVTSCQGKEEDTPSFADSMSQQIGDAMVSIDDSGGSDGGYALLNREGRNVARLSSGQKRGPWLRDALVPQAFASSCFVTNTWGSCTSNVVVRDFQGCTIQGATFTGQITYNFTDAAVDSTCSIAADGHSVARNPNFTISGSRGGTFTVSKTGTNGQTITRTGAGAFSFANDGIRRVLSFGGSTLADYTTSTTSAIGVAGATRNGRIASGGALRVLNNLTGVSCDFAPSAVTWASGCNCATSGTWSATCSNGVSASLSLLSCGSGTFVLGTESTPVTLDQCASN
jgi:hypothetical protein